MKLSNIKGEAAVDVLAEILIPVGNILADDMFMDLLNRESKPEGETAYEVAINRLRTNIPALIKNHKDDLFVILAALSLTTPEEYKKNCTLPSMIADVNELINDPEFVAFFTSAEKTDTTESAFTSMIAPVTA